MSPGANRPPNASPKTHTTRPQPTLTTPAPWDHRPRGATRRSRPTPNWIHTADAAASAGWRDQAVAPKCTRPCTQPGDVEAGGPEHVRRQAQRHLRLELQQAVDDPQGAEADTQDPPGHGLGAGLGTRSGQRPAGGQGPAVLHGPEHVPGGEEEDEDHEDDRTLTDEGRVERLDDDGVTRSRRSPHARHHRVPSLRTVVTLPSAYRPGPFAPGAPRARIRGRRRPSSDAAGIP